MTILPIVTDLAALRVKSQPVTVFDDDLRRLAADMVETMRANNGIGLAAVQVGVPMRVICFRRAADKACVMVNPALVWAAKSKNPDYEGCLSLPGQFREVDRATEIEVEWYTLRKKNRIHRFSVFGAYGRVIQHELDHLDGVLITDYALAKDGAR